MKNDVKCTHRKENECTYGHIFLALKTSMSISSDSENIFEEFILYPDSRVVTTGTGCISIKREIIVLPKILGKYMSYNFWVAPLEFSSHKDHTMICCLCLTKLLDLIDFRCLMPLSAIFQLYHGDQF
jgi:hypothetical protein